MPDRISKGTDPDPEPARSRRAGAPSAAGAVAAAVTSRTAGWMVAAALAGSLATLGVVHGTSQPAAGQVTIKNAGRVAVAPSGSSKHGRMWATRLTPKRVYVGPGDPLATGALPQVSGGAAWVAQPACAVPGHNGPPFSKRQQRIVTIPVPKHIVIGRTGHHKLQQQGGQITVPKRIRLARPACAMFPLRCRADLRIAIGQVPAATRVQVEQRGRFFATGQGQQPPRWARVRFPAVVVVPSPRLTGSPGPQCVAFWPRQR